MAISEASIDSTQVSPKGFTFDEGYSWLITSLEKTRDPKYAIKTAARNFLRIYLPLNLKPGEKLLDIGSNIGTLGHFLKYFGIHTVNVDLNFDALMAGRKVYGNERRNTLIAADGRLLPFLDDSFDGVASQDVFEHLPSEESATRMLEEITRVLKPGRNKIFIKITVLEDEKHIHGDQSHYIKWPTEDWEDFFESRGWDILRNPTRHFPIMSQISYGNFLLRRSAKS